ncbi:MAG: branched-chain amino acid ABC transporter permease [Candidatus Tectomicrobia bacterium]|uniref:Branched-chain amino acid ABC transporter permease n=1 Tax=Tectimicrobiota bacterium TaxID=2528274 RepID=A0A933LQX5_UNCTE|nr:branched-chain amino acid ABC transporter permease [Candidatus Tectomicrobia bacterium]
MGTFSQLLQYILTGLTVGSIYAITALGFNIIYSSTDIINFAQGEFAMLGALIMIFFSNVLHLPLPLAFLLSVISVTLIGAVFERAAIHPLKDASTITLIIITIGVSILLKGAAMFLWGKDSFALPPFSGDKPIRVMGATILPQALWVLGITIAVVFLLAFFFEKTILGKSLRACADNRIAARLLGIEVSKMVLFSFSISAALGAVAGMIIAPISLMEYDRGTMLGLKGFSAAVFGGLGSFGGAIVAGFALGIIESLGAGFISSGFKDAIALLVLLAVLFLRPAGIFGTPKDEKV